MIATANRDLVEVYAKVESDRAVGDSDEPVFANLERAADTVAITIDTESGKITVELRFLIADIDEVVVRAVGKGGSNEKSERST